MTDLHFYPTAEEMRNDADRYACQWYETISLKMRCICGRLTDGILVRFRITGQIVDTLVFCPDCYRNQNRAS